MSLLLSVYLYQSVFQLDSNCVIGTVSFSFSFIGNLSQQPPKPPLFQFVSVCHSQLTPALSGSDREGISHQNKTVWGPLPFSCPLESVTHTLSHWITHLQYRETTRQEANRCCLPQSTTCGSIYRLVNPNAVYLFWSMLVFQKWNRLVQWLLLMEFYIYSSEIAVQ